jgi:hypothetical protein
MLDHLTPPFPGLSPLLPKPPAAVARFALLVEALRYRN